MTKELSSPTGFSVGDSSYFVPGGGGLMPHRGRTGGTEAGGAEAGGTEAGGTGADNAYSEANGGESLYLPKTGSFRRLTAARAAISTNRA